MIAHFTMARIAIPFGIAALAAMGTARPPRGIGATADRDSSITRDWQSWTIAEWALAALSFAMLAALAMVCVNHVRFPYNIETMEGVVLQHVQQVVHGQPVYPQPSPAYAPLAYNPGYYFLSAPFVALFGPTVAVLRVVAILGVIVSALVIFIAVRRLTGSPWWGIVATGCFAAAYRVMDSALDNAHSDSWLLAAALAGTEVLDRATTRRGRLLGVLLLVLSFWFKQHGALFAVGGVLYLTWRFGVRQSLPYWLLAGLLGAGLYAAAFTWPFGFAFHYFTWRVPSGWSTLSGHTFVRIAWLAATAYPILIVAAARETYWAAAATRQRITAWHVQFLAGVCSAIMGGLDWGCSDNVYIPFGGFTIVMGAVGLWRWLASDTNHRPRPVARASAAVLMAVTMAVLMYDVRDVMLPINQGRAAYADLLDTVHHLNGPVFIPSLGYAEGEHTLMPQVVWVAPADMVRGHHRTAMDTALMWQTLTPALHPAQPAAYILTNAPLAKVPGPVSQLAACYTLTQDFGDRFTALKGPVKHFFPDWPRYLYQYDPATPCQQPNPSLPAG